jgi:beta-glucosidase
VSRPVRQLKGFRKVFLAPGEEKRVQMAITAGDLSFIGRDNTRIIEPGAFTLMINKFSRPCTLRADAVHRTMNSEGTR